jgi:hypothetical protein
MPLDWERDLDLDALFARDETGDGGDREERDAERRGADRYEWTAYRHAADEVHPVDMLRHFPAERTHDGYRIPFPNGFCEDCLARPLTDETSGAVAWLCEHLSLIVALDVRGGEVAYLPWLRGRERFERAFSLASAEAAAVATAMTEAISRKLH